MPIVLLYAIHKSELVLARFTPVSSDRPEVSLFIVPRLPRFGPWRRSCTRQSESFATEASSTRCADSAGRHEMRVPHADRNVVQTFSYFISASLTNLLYEHFYSAGCVPCLVLLLFQATKACLALQELFLCGYSFVVQQADRRHQGYVLVPQEGVLCNGSARTGLCVRGRHKPS